MTNFEFVACFLTLIGILVVSAMLYSDSFAEIKNASKNTVMATILTIFAALLVAAYVDFIYYAEFALWHFCLITFSVFSITIGMSVILAMFKMNINQRKEYREYKKLARETEKFISNKKAEIRKGSYRPTYHNDYSKADKCVIKEDYRKII